MGISAVSVGPQPSSESLTLRPTHLRGGPETVLRETREPASRVVSGAAGPPQAGPGAHVSTLLGKHPYRKQLPGAATWDSPPLWCCHSWADPAPHNQRVPPLRGPPAPGRDSPETPELCQLPTPPFCQAPCRPPKHTHLPRRPGGGPSSQLRQDPTGRPAARSVPQRQRRLHAWPQTVPLVPRQQTLSGPRAQLCPS